MSLRGKLPPNNLTPVIVKHSGKSYPVEVDLSEPGLTFKLQIYSLTNVPPERQKVLLKGGQLKDDSDLSGFNLKEGQTIMVLGTADAPVETPKQEIKFVEDLDPKDLNFNPNNEPSGLVNLGNTCYLNSSLQSLYAVDEIRDRLAKYSKNGTGPEQNLVFNLKELFEKMQQRKQRITPLNFLTTMRLNFPQFSERDDHGFYKQQDAEEAYSQILSAVQRQLSGLEQFFKIEFKTTTRCLETSEDPVYGYEEALKLDCHISINTNFLKDGLLSNLKETIEKNNESLGRNSEYEISRKITRLPKYLTVHFVRFFWKRDTGKKSKILRKVQFPFQLDLIDLVDEGSKEDKAKVRDAIYKVEKQNEEESRAFKKSKLSADLSTREQYNQQQQELDKLKEKWATNFKGALPESYDASSGENPSSLYELVSVIAHQGSSADSGHYQCFVKDPQDLTGDKWFKFNDDKVSVIGRDKIEALAGGGEGDSALILIGLSLLALMQLATAVSAWTSDADLTGLASLSFFRPSAAFVSCSFTDATLAPSSLAGKRSDESFASSLASLLFSSDLSFLLTSFSTTWAETCCLEKFVSTELSRDEMRLELNSTGVCGSISFLTEKSRLSFELSFTSTYTTPCTLNDTSLVLIDDPSFEKQYSNLPASWALICTSPCETSLIFSMILPDGALIQKSAVSCSVESLSRSVIWNVTASSSWALSTSKKHCLPLAGSRATCASAGTISSRDIRKCLMAKRKNKQDFGGFFSATFACSDGHHHSRRVEKNAQ
ncbi:hypothetical protein OGAPHI_006518 [Ogataea philodendri]|uniref:Ubiquitin carboxyl-terminal hydrolase n=1 Tax=Ogataea philodendri TaxID=1378263 RepID=A0A9P8T0D7_9ASCO|nr:uncharacterized protein OGAPHI_006518 [Ogataea philodendri]KAH3661668.1 hypothetical protein OGAPHI_006518 [Ogataea philodendri]